MSINSDNFAQCVLTISISNFVSSFIVPGRCRGHLLSFHLHASLPVSVEHLVCFSSWRLFPKWNLCIFCICIILQRWLKHVENDHVAVRYELNSAHTQLSSLTSLETMAFLWVTGNFEVHFPCCTPMGSRKSRLLSSLTHAVCSYFFPSCGLLNSFHIHTYPGQQSWLFSNSHSCSLMIFNINLLLLT